jgi:uncharacterized protein (DUF1499 family)
MDARGATAWGHGILIGAIIGAALLPIGALGYRIGLWSYQTGFLFLAAGALLSIFTVIGGLVALVSTLKARGSEGRAQLLIGLLLGGAVVLLLAIKVGDGRSTPAIHDVSTDVGDPPAFDKAIALRDADANPLDYDLAANAAKQQNAYPRVKPIRTDRSVDSSFDRALDVLGSMRLDVVNVDRDDGVIEAVATSFWFGFKDDVVVRVRARGDGATVDMRSVSRVGVGDLGVNAKRIEEFIERFNEA